MRLQWHEMKLIGRQGPCLTVAFGHACAKWLAREQAMNELSQCGTVLRSISGGFP